MLPDRIRAGDGELSAEPRVLDDGRTVLVSTFNCGLYLMLGLDTDTPGARQVGSFPRKKDTFCAIPVIAGHYYLVTVPAENAVVSLDLTDPAAPRDVSRVTLGPDTEPHWIAISPGHRRVVLTGYGALEHRVLILTFDQATGRLELDKRFRPEGVAEPGWRTEGVAHGAVFGRQ